MKKKDYLLRNRIITAVLAAVLAQSLFFGLVLLSLQGFTVLSRQPYETMQLRLKDKNDVVSNTLNHIYLEGMGLKRQLKKTADMADLHSMMVDVLNKADCLSAVAYMSTEANEGIYYMDEEPQEYSVDASDISCAVGTSQSDVKIRMSNLWRKKFLDESYETACRMAEEKDRMEGWYYDSAANAFYYVLYAENGDRTGLIFLEVLEASLQRLFEESSEQTGGMQFSLADENGEFYSGKQKLPSVSVLEKEANGAEKIFWMYGWEEYIGYRQPIKVYGSFSGEQKLYIQVLGRKSEIQAPVQEMMAKIVIAYAFSLAVCLLACWGSTYVILKPLREMLENIKKLRGRVIQCSDGAQAVEIRSIYNALNDVTKRLEESHSRYNFAMEEVEQNLGSFLYHNDTMMTDISRSVEEILQIPKEYITKDRKMSVLNWEKIVERLTVFEELNAYTFSGADETVHCVAFKQKEEENGVFGVVMDKTVEYHKISQLRFASEHDFLTKLNNASYMREQGDKLLSRHQEKINAMMFCDLDNLKYVNDHYGHSMGDTYIVAMADKLKWCTDKLQREMPEKDVIAARISGDEFAVLFAGFDSREQIQDIVAMLYRKKCFIRLSEKEEFPVRVSIGFAYADKEHTSVEQLLKCADKAMYAVKSSDKNGVALYVDDSHAEKLTLSLEEQMQNANP